MGNQQSDLGEQEAWKVIGHIPVVNFFYGGIRAAVYASKNNMEEAHSGALAMIPFAHNVIHLVDPAATKKAIEQAEQFLRQKEEMRHAYWILVAAFDIFKASNRLWRGWDMIRASKHMGCDIFGRLRALRESGKLK